MLLKSSFSARSIHDVALGSVFLNGLRSYFRGIAIILCNLSSLSWYPKAQKKFEDNKIREI